VHAYGPKSPRRDSMLRRLSDFLLSSDGVVSDGARSRLRSFVRQLYNRSRLACRARRSDPCV